MIFEDFCMFSDDGRIVQGTWGVLCISPSRSSGHYCNSDHESGIHGINDTCGGWESMWMEL